MAKATKKALGNAPKKRPRKGTKRAPAKKPATKRRRKTAKCPACGSSVHDLPRGRPSDLSPALAAKLEALMHEGYSKVSALRVVGVPESTFYRWQQSARDGVEPYATLMWGVAQAEEEYIHDIEQEVRSGITIARTPDSAARIAFLKSRREEWQQKLRIESVRQDVTVDILRALMERAPELHDRVVEVLTLASGDGLALPEVVEVESVEVN